MANIVPDGIYQILNHKYSGYAVDLIDANPFGTVSGFSINSGSSEQKWRVKNLGSNRITLESIAAPNSYASVYTFLTGVALAGSPNPTVWVVKDLGNTRYQLSTVDDQFQWVLPNGEGYSTIKFEAYQGAPDHNAQWKFNRI